MHRCHLSAITLFMLIEASRSLTQRHKNHIVMHVWHAYQPHCADYMDYELPYEGESH